jgi:diguanylate cyclase (GGDEF)-like protein
LFFLLLARHDRRGYLRDWTYAWIAQLAALALLFAGPEPGSPQSPGLFLLLEGLHGVLLCAAAHRYARGVPMGWLPLLSLLPIAVGIPWASRLFDGPRPLQAAAGGILAATHVAAAVLLWSPRRQNGMGLRLVTNLLLILGALHVAHAVIFGAPLPEAQVWVDYQNVAPFTTLLLQMLLALGMVLAAMETGQRDLAAANEKLEEAQRRLKILADTDPMTGCFNRRVFRDLVDEVRADPKRASGSILVLDMDGLKALNDSKGHSAGDQAIRRTADAIRSHTREGDLVLRWGGDEFVVVLPGASMEEGARRSEGISAAIVGLGLGASVGLCAYGPEHDIVLAVREADRQMYEVKAARKASQAAVS